MGARWRDGNISFTAWLVSIGAAMPMQATKRAGFGCGNTSHHSKLTVLL
jgi:hypothetical protein